MEIKGTENADKLAWKATTLTTRQIHDIIILLYDYTNFLKKIMSFYKDTVKVAQKAMFTKASTKLTKNAMI